MAEGSQLNITRLDIDMQLSVCRMCYISAFDMCIYTIYIAMN